MLVGHTPYASMQHYQASRANLHWLLAFGGGRGGLALQGASRLKRLLA